MGPAGNTEALWDPRALVGAGSRVLGPVLLSLVLNLLSLGPVLLSYVFNLLSLGPVLLSFRTCFGPPTCLSTLSVPDTRFSHNQVQKAIK